MTVTGWMLLWGLVAFLFGWVIFLYGYYLGGVFEGKFWGRRVDETDASLRVIMKNRDYWERESQNWYEAWKKERLKLIVNQDFQTSGTKQEIIEQKSNTIEFPETLVMPYPQEKKSAKKKNVSKFTTRDRRGESFADRDSRPNKSKAFSRKRRS